MTLVGRFAELEKRFAHIEKEVYEYKNKCTIKVGEDIFYDMGAKGYWRGKAVVTEINLLRRKETSELYWSFKIFCKKSANYYDIELYEITNE